VPGLPETVALLALDPEKGRLRGAYASGNSAMAAACLQELELRGRTALRGRKVTVIDATPTGEAALDAILAAVAGQKRPRSLHAWLGRLLAQHPTRLVLHALAARGAASRTRQRILFFPVVRYVPDGLARAAAVALLDEQLAAGAGPVLEHVVASGLLRKVRPATARAAVRQAGAAARRNPYARAQMDRQAEADSASAAAVILPSG
jgi:hypothetical protein